MIKLERIILVQFFLYEKMDIPVSDICGLFGPNGSGKSASLDATQIAMLGGNLNHIAFNAQADEGNHNTRSLRSYCLGQYSDAEEARVRDNATTYITLIWRDDVTQLPTSMGLCITASADTDKHEIEGRYLLPGIELTMQDHLNISDGQEVPQAWNVFNQTITSYAKATNNPEPIFSKPEKFVRAMLLALGPIQNHDAYTRAFQFALRMKYDKSVDEIVRKHVLEPRPTNIKKFKEVTESFRRLQQLVHDVEKKIGDAKSVMAVYEDVAEQARQDATWNALKYDVQGEIAQDAFNKADEVCVEAQEALQQANENKECLERDRDQAQENHDHYRQLRDEHAAHANFNLLGIQIENKRSLVKTKIGQFHNSSKSMHQLLGQYRDHALLADSENGLEDIVQSLVLVNQSPLEQPRQSMVEILRRALIPLQSAYCKCGGLLHEKKSLLNEQEDQAKGLRSALSRVSAGKRPLSVAAQRLQNALEDQGIEAIPVCDLVEISDPAWQPVIESYLSVNREALLVCEQDEEAAFRVYRGTRDIYGAKIARESYYAHAEEPRRGAVGELITSNRSAAANYFRALLGQTMRAETSEEALASSRTLTKDGMLTYPGSFDRLKPMAKQDFMIGRGDSDQQRKSIIRQLEDVEKTIVRLKKEIADHETLQDKFSPFASIESALEHLMSDWDEASTANEDATSLARKMTNEADAEYQNLVAQVAHWDAEQKRLNGDISEMSRKIGNCETALNNARLEHTLKKQRLQEIRGLATEAYKHQDYDSEYAGAQWDHLMRKFEQNYVEMEKECAGKQSAAARKFTHSTTLAATKLGAFVTDHRDNVAAEIQLDWRKAREWLAGLIKMLEETELQDYREQMDEAYRTSQATFRQDVAQALSDRLNDMQNLMDRLNQVLRTCPVFSNGERYQFRRHLRPEHDRLYRFIRDIEEHGADGDLFGDPGEIPETFRQLLDDKISGVTGKAGPLDDYREFYSFDIDIQREDSKTGKLTTVGKLSKRIGTGSGGEHRAPLYVIAGAALASAYQLENGHTEGMALILLDEAFHKMDATNIIATMRYYENLGLQVLMASPGENLPILNAFLHRYYDIVRDAETNVVLLEGHDVSPEMRAMFRDDLVEFNPELLAGEIDALRAATVPAPALG